MADSGLPCYIQNTLSNLKARFHPEYNEGEAAKFMIDQV